MENRIKREIALPEKGGMRGGGLDHRRQQCPVLVREVPQI